jgi:hypothetical protein
MARQHKPLLVRESREILFISDRSVIDTHRQKYGFNNQKVIIIVYFSIPNLKSNQLRHPVEKNTKIHNPGQ